MPRHALGAEPTTGRATAAKALAALLAVLGLALVIVGACSSRSGPAQPAAVAGSSVAATSAAGTSPVSAASITAASMTAGSTTAAPSTTASPTAIAAPSTTAAPKSTAAASSRSSAPGTTAKAPTSAPRSTGPVPRPSNTVVVPSFQPQVTGPVLAKSAPTALRIPALGVTSPMLDLGLLPDGTIATPPLDDPESKAGWYTGSPAPGTQGPSIVLGHVDSKKYGPGVFYELGALKPGDTIEITRADRTVAVFRVDAVRSYPKASFPTEEIYGNLDHAGLRLITCGGTFDPAKGSYESNIIAFASLVGSHKV